MLYWVEIWYGAWKRAPLSSLFSRPTPPPPPHDYRRPYPLEPRPPAPGYTKGWWRDSGRGILATWHIYCFAPSGKCPFAVTSGVCPYQTVIAGAFQFQQWTMDTYNYVSCPIIPSDLFIYLYPGFRILIFFEDPDPEKMIFFLVFFTFQMILNNGCLKSEQKKWNCLHCTSPTLQDNDLFIHFLTFLPGSGYGQGKNMRIRADPDPDPKPC